MKTSTPSLLFLLFFISIKLATAQHNDFSHENFEARFLSYTPTQKKTVSDKDFSFAKMVIRETKNAIKGDSKGFNVADYWNICTAFYTLDESRESLTIAFQKMLASDGSCEYLSSLKDKTKLDELFPEAYQQQLDLCAQLPDKKAIDLKAYAKQYQLDLQVLQEIKRINQRDQKYRNEDYETFRKEQTKLDLQNQSSINALFEIHQTYLGKSLVGEAFETVMWSVIQHSNLAMMKKYLPIIEQAVRDKELPLAPLKMLVDRIYTIQYNYQIFGSQQAVPLAEDALIKAVRKKYEID